MGLSRERIEDFIEDLEDDAEVIESGIKEIYESAESGRSGVGQRWEWKTDDETEKAIRETRRNYEQWYAACSQIIQQNVPNRFEEFQDHYGYIKERISLEGEAPLDVENAGKNLIDQFHQQRDILHTVPPTLEANHLSAHRQMSKRVAKDEITRSRELLAESLPRASGVVAGVALERHLLTKCEESDEITNFSHDDGIGNLSNKLYNAGEIDKTTLNSLQTLSSIRADCAHANQEEPSPHKVRRLIEDTEDYIRGRGI